MCHICDPNSSFWKSEALVRLKMPGMVFCLSQALEFLASTQVTYMLAPSPEIKKVRDGAQSAWDTLYPEYRELILRDVKSTRMSLDDIDKMLTEVLKNKGKKHE